MHTTSSIIKRTIIMAAIGTSTLAHAGDVARMD
jgi:hypothetical protein